METKYNWNEQSSGLLTREFTAPNQVSTKAQREKFIKKLAADIDHFLANGGTVTLLPSCKSSFENVFDPNRAKLTKKYGHKDAK